MKNNPQRAVPDEDTAKLKNELYQMAFGTMKQDLKDCRWLECIAIAESVISDRIESVMSKKGFNHTLNTLRQNIVLFKKYADQRDKDFDELSELLSNWAIEGNYALHRMVKVEIGDSLDWNQRLQRMQKTAEEGLSLANKMNNWSKRKYNK